MYLSNKSFEYSLSIIIIDNGVENTHCNKNQRPNAALNYKIVVFFVSDAMLISGSVWRRVSDVGILQILCIGTVVKCIISSHSFFW